MKASLSCNSSAAAACCLLATVLFQAASCSNLEFVPISPLSQEVAKRWDQATYSQLRPFEDLPPSALEDGLVQRLYLAAAARAHQRREQQQQSLPRYIKRESFVPSRILRREDNEYKLMSDYPSGAAVVRPSLARAVQDEVALHQAQMANNKAQRRLRSDPAWSTLVAATDADQMLSKQQGKRNQYMLLRKGRDTSSEELTWADISDLGLKLEHDTKLSPSTTGEQNHISKLTKREANHRKGKKGDGYYLRFKGM